MNLKRCWLGFDTRVATADASSGNNPHLLILRTILSSLSLFSAEVNPHHAGEASSRMAKEVPF